MMRLLKYKKLKKVITDKEERYVIERDVYNIDDGSFKETIEEMVDPVKLAERAKTLRNEAGKIEQLTNDIKEGNFEEIEDKRNNKGE